MANSDSNYWRLPDSHFSDNPEKANQPFSKEVESGSKEAKQTLRGQGIQNFSPYAFRSRNPHGSTYQMPLDENLQVPEIPYDPNYFHPDTINAARSNATNDVTAQVVAGVTAPLVAGGVAYANTNPNAAFKGPIPYSNITNKVDAGNWSYFNDPNAGIGKKFGMHGTNIGLTAALNKGADYLSKQSDSSRIEEIQKIHKQKYGKDLSEEDAKAWLKTAGDPYENPNIPGAFWGYGIGDVIGKNAASTIGDYVGQGNSPVYADRAALDYAFGLRNPFYAFLNRTAGNIALRGGFHAQNEMLADQANSANTWNNIQRKAIELYSGQYGGEEGVKKHFPHLWPVKKKKEVKE